jgi:hypothetical protein
MTPDEYERRSKGLDLITEIMTLGLSVPRLGEALEPSAMLLGLPQGYTVADLDQKIAGLREGLLRGGGG